jgi:CheY-like chemotaxis protein
MVDILVVDDDRDVRESLADILVSKGHVVRTAADGREALSQLRERIASLILLDLMMPVMDGPAFLSALRADPSLAAVPVIVATASDASALHGIRRCLRKPYDVEELLKEVSRRLEEP